MLNPLKGSRPRACPRCYKRVSQPFAVGGPFSFFAALAFPMVFEHVTGIRGARIERALVAGARGGVVLLSEIWGIDDALRTYASKLVAEQFSVAMPDPWARKPRPALDSPDAVVAAVAEVDDGEMLADVGAARTALGGDVPVFVVGFCMGGLYARMAACTIPRLAGAVEFYGRVHYAALSAKKPTQPLDLLPGLACPLQCHFGDDDALSPPHHVDDLVGRLAKSPCLTQVFRYPGRGHAFMNPTRQNWHADDAELAWDRALTFLDHLAVAAHG